MQCFFFNIFLILIFVTPFKTKGQESIPTHYSPNQIHADIDTLIANLQEFHPTYQQWFDAHDMHHRVEAIKESVTQPISKLDFFRLMQPVVAIDGHTTMLYNGPLCDNEAHPLIPFEIVVYNDKIYVKENFSGDNRIEKGTCLERINGIPASEVIHQIYQYIPGERDQYKARKLEEQFHVFMALVYGSFSEFTVLVNGEELELNGVGWEQFQPTEKPKFELRFYDDNIAYIYKRMFMPPRDFLHFIDSAFAVIEERNIEHLIIDNLSGGGLTDLADTLTSYFAKKPYRLMEQKQTKLSSLTEELLADKKSEGYIEDGYFYEAFSTHNPYRKNKFHGQTYILTGPRSYSTGTCFPAAAKCYDNALIVGEESGQPLLSNGDQNQFILPHSGMRIISALSVVHMPCNGGDTVHGVFPDLTYSPSLEDLLNDKNYTLKYTLQYIRESK
jgi:hypothetical protein